MPGLNDRWTTRDYPVLEWIVGAFDNPDYTAVTDDAISDALNLSQDDVYAAAKNLDRGGYLANVTWSFGKGFRIVDITERALRETGLWPNDEAVADQLMWFLERKVETASTADERSRWTKIRDGFVGGGRDVAVELVAAIAARSIGA